MGLQRPECHCHALWQDWPARHSVGNCNSNNPKIRPTSQSTCYLSLIHDWDGQRNTYLKHLETANHSSVYGYSQSYQLKISHVTSFETLVVSAGSWAVRMQYWHTDIHWLQQMKSGHHKQPQVQTIPSGNLT